MDPNKIEMAKWMKIADTNGDGRIDYKEFVNRASATKVFELNGYKIGGDRYATLRLQTDPQRTVTEGRLLKYTSTNSN